MYVFVILFYCNDTPTTEIYTYGHTLSLHDALPISPACGCTLTCSAPNSSFARSRARFSARSEEHTSELQSLMRISYAVFCLKKKNVSFLKIYITYTESKQMITTVQTISTSILNTLYTTITSTPNTTLTSIIY